MDLTAFIRDVPDFPKPGIVFKDIAPLLEDRAAFRTAVVQLAHPYRDAPVDLIVGIESRGFIFGAALALELGAGFVPVRKSGNMPGIEPDFNTESARGSARPRVFRARAKSPVQGQTRGRRSRH